MKIENSFILFPGVGRKTEEKLWKKNITHWEEFLDNSETTGKKREKIEKGIQKAQKNLDVRNSLFFQEKFPNKSMWRMYENFKDNVCYFDIETTGLKPGRNKTTTVSFHRKDKTTALVRGEDLTRENLEKEFFESDLIVTFNGKRFDQPFLEKEFDMNIKTPHIDLMYLCKRIGYSGGLKKIEKEMNIKRELEDVDGREAIKLWKKYENNNNEEALDKLIKYNKYDAKNLEDLMKRVHSEIANKVFIKKQKNKA